MYSTAVSATAPSRRERLRAATTAEIKTHALALLDRGGPAAITLRAIAREMGMTANAIYGYFATRDELVTALIDEVYTSLVDTVEAARDEHTDPGERLIAWAVAFRRWSVSNPAGFRLVYGDPVPGYQAPATGAAPLAAQRACLGLVGLTIAARPTAVEPATGDYRWEDFDPDLTDKVRQTFPGLKPDTVALALRVWGRMHGLVSLEIYGHLRQQLSDPGRLYREELTRLVAALGLSDTD